MIDFSNFYQLIAKKPAVSLAGDAACQVAAGSAMPCTASFVNGSAP